MRFLAAIRALFSTPTLTVPAGSHRCADNGVRVGTDADCVVCDDFRAHPAR